MCGKERVIFHLLRVLGLQALPASVSSRLRATDATNPVRHRKEKEGLCPSVCKGSRFRFSLGAAFGLGS